MPVKVRRKTKLQSHAAPTMRRRAANAGKKPLPPSSGLDDRIDLGSLGDMIGFLIRLAQIRVFELFYQDFKSSKLGPGESSVLAAIHYNPGVRQGVLASALHIKRSNMAKMIARLNRKRLIERSIPSVDKRAIQLHLSKSGEQLIAHLLPRMIEHNRQLEKTCCGSDRTLLIQFLQNISRHRGNQRHRG